jgi:hypothetical protein
MSIVAVLTVIGLVIGLTPNPDDTEIKSLEAITGHTFNLQANLIVDPHYVGILDPTGIVTLRFNDDNYFLLTVRAKGLEDLCRHVPFAWRDLPVERPFKDSILITDISSESGAHFGTCK